ncbi:MAG: sugar phosphate isomerase/epimerase family protein [Anaerolineae bacterium]
MSRNRSVGSKSKQAIGLFPWASPGDRFMSGGYRETLPLVEQLQHVAKLSNLVEGIELRYPSEVNEETLPLIRQFLKDTGLAVAAVGTPISSERRFAHGSLTARDPQVRKGAIRRAQEGMDICAELGGNQIYFFLGQDGCDYALEVDYEDAWKWMIEGIAEIAAHRRDIRVCLEYKPFEPRRRIFLNNVGISLYVIHQVGAENVGVLFDTGHAMMAGENLGDSIYLLSKAKRLFHIHFNDNYRNFDDDMAVGSVHLLPFVEAVYWLKRVGYTGWQSLDLYPYREEPEVAVVQSIKLLKRIDALVDEMGLETITELLRQGDGGCSAQEVYRHLFGI